MKRDKGSNKQRKEDIMTKTEELETEEESEEECNESDEEDDEEEMTKSEARDYVEEQINDDFMDDVTPEKMTPEKAAKEIKKLEEDIDNFKKRSEQIEAIAVLSENSGLKSLITELQSIIEAKTKDLEIKDMKAMTKVLESALLVQEKIRIFKSEYDAKISGIKSYSDSIERIKAQGYQPSLFDQKEEPVAEEVEQPNLASEVEEETAEV